MKLDEATILVVDDEADLREIFSRWLGRNGCRVLTAPNGAEALKILETEKIHALVSDIRMPVMGGVELARRVYELELHIPSIIFVSGFGDVEPREMYGLGVEMLLEKPLNRKDFIHALEESLMEREKLWLTPVVEPMVQSVAADIESLGGALRTCQFQLGRGGCCFLSDRMLEEEKSVDLSLRFVRDGLCLKAQGIVRWVDKETARAGVSFGYLEPECREWVFSAMRNGSYRSFIPQCRGGPSDRPIANASGSSFPVEGAGSGYMTGGASMPR